jgi:hypothetical protein
MKTKKRIALLLAIAIMISAISVSLPMEAKAYDGWINHIQKVSLDTDLSSLLANTHNWTYGTCPKPYNYESDTIEHWFQIFQVNVPYKSTLTIMKQSSDLYHFIGYHQTFEMNFGVFDTNGKSCIDNNGQYVFSTNYISNDKDSYCSHEYNSANGLYTFKTYVDVNPGTYNILVIQDTFSWVTTAADLEEYIPETPFTCTIHAEPIVTQQDNSGQQNNALANKVRASKPNIQTVKTSKKSVTLKLKKKSYVSGANFEIQYRVKGAGKWDSVIVKKPSSLKVKKLAKNIKYQFRVRQVTTLNGQKVSGKWSKVKTVKVK